MKQTHTHTHTQRHTQRHKHTITVSLHIYIYIISQCVLHLQNVTTFNRLGCPSLGLSRLSKTKRQGITWIADYEF